MGAVIAAHISKPVQGAHGWLVLSGGSYDTAGARTDHFLNPVVLENYTNAGTPADFAVSSRLISRRRITWRPMSATGSRVMKSPTSSYNRMPANCRPGMIFQAALLRWNRKVADGASRNSFKGRWCGRGAETAPLGHTRAECIYEQQRESRGNQYFCVFISTALAGL